MRCKNKFTQLRRIHRIQYVVCRVIQHKCRSGTQLRSLNHRGVRCTRWCMNIWGQFRSRSRRSGNNTLRKPQQKIEWHDCREEALINGIFQDSGSKGEERNVCCAIVRNHIWFPGRIQKPNTLKITDVKESVTNRGYDAFRFTFRWTGWHDEIHCHRYGRIVNSNRRGRGERKNLTEEKNSNHCFTVRVDANSRRNYRPNCKFAPDQCVLIFPEKRHRVDNASISNICR